MRTVLFWDWDGTIADSMSLCIEEVRLALARCGYPPVSEDRLAACNGPTYDQAAAIVGVPEAGREAFYRARLQAEMEIIPTVQRLFPGIPEALRRLAGQAEMAVVSNGLPAYLDACLTHYGMKDLFVRLEPWREGRSKADALRDAYEALKPDRCIMIGDRAGDVEAARSCGIPCVCAAYGYGTPEEAALGDAAAQTAAELEEILTAFIRTGECRKRV